MSAFFEAFHPNWIMSHIQEADSASVGMPRVGLAQNF